MSVLRPLLRPLLREPLRSVLTRRGGWTPLILFAAGEQGGWWDPSDFSTMFQDSAGTTPVTATGQPVGKILDKSGRGNHLSQATAASCPVLQQDAGGLLHLLFDGVDDSLSSAAFAMGADKLTVCTGLRKLADATFGMPLDFGTSVAGNLGVWYLGCPSGTKAFEFERRGTGAAAFTSTAVLAAPATAVVTGGFDLAAATEVTALRLNGADSGSPGVADTGTGNFGTYALHMGRQGGATLPFNGRMYQAIVRAAASNAGQIGLIERFVGARTGIAL